MYLYTLFNLQKKKFSAIVTAITLILTIICGLYIHRESMN